MTFNKETESNYLYLCSYIRYLIINNRLMDLYNESTYYLTFLLNLTQNHETISKITVINKMNKRFENLDLQLQFNQMKKKIQSKHLNTTNHKIIFEI